MHFNQFPGRYRVTLEPKDHTPPCALPPHPNRMKNREEGKDPASEHFRKQWSPLTPRYLTTSPFSAAIFTKKTGPGLPGNSSSRESAFPLDCSSPGLCGISPASWRAWGSREKLVRFSGLLPCSHHFTVSFINPVSLATWQIPHRMARWPPKLISRARETAQTTPATHEGN